MGNSVEKQENKVTNNNCVAQPVTNTYYAIRLAVGSGKFNESGVGKFLKRFVLQRGKLIDFRFHVAVV